MSRQQARRRETGQDEGRDPSSIKYGDVFNVSGELASKPVTPQDAAMMQAAETEVYGRTPKGGPAATMQQAATVNERAGVVAHTDVTDAAGDQGVTVMETGLPGARLFTESVAGQVVAQYVEPTPMGQPGGAGNGANANAAQAQESAEITIGEALEASAFSARDKPVEQSDAAAIQAAEVRASGTNVITPGGLAAFAQSAASYNAQVTRDDDKIKLGDVLANATAKLPADKVASRQDAEGVVRAALRNNPDLGTHPGGVAASVTAAARINERGSR